MPQEPPRAREPAAANVVKEPSPPAREFDGTFNVKPQVYGTYAAQREEYDHSEGDYREADRDYRGPREDGGRGEYPRYRDYEYPPPDAHEHERDRPQGYGYDYPPRPPPGSRDYPPFPPGRERPLPPTRAPGSPTRMDFESRDYGHSRPRPEYQGQFREGLPHPHEGARYERGYPHPPPPEPFRGPSMASHAHPPMEDDRYYGPTREKEKPPSIASQLETIDYSHGSGNLPIQSVDYHHGQPGDAVDRRKEPGYRDRPPKMDDYPPGPPSRYESYPPHPGYAPVHPYPPGYHDGYPPPFPPYGGSPGTFLPPGLDPASLFAAYTGQTGEYVQYHIVMHIHCTQ